MTINRAMICKTDKTGTVHIEREKLAALKGKEVADMKGLIDLVTDTFDNLLFSPHKKDWMTRINPATGNREYGMSYTIRCGKFEETYQIRIETI